MNKSSITSWLILFGVLSFFAQTSHPCAKIKQQHKAATEKQLLNKQVLSSNNLMNNYDVKFHHLNLNLLQQNLW
jgi:hypothetical protein